MGDAMQAAGVGPEVEYKGKVYKFQPVRVKEIGRFEAWIVRGAWEEVARAETWMPPAMFTRMEDRTHDKVIGKALAYGSRAFRSAQVSDAGIKEMALISLKAGEDNAPEIDGELIVNLFKDKPAEMATVMVGIGWLRAVEKAKPDDDK